MSEEDPAEASPRSGGSRQARQPLYAEAARHDALHHFDFILDYQDKRFQLAQLYNVPEVQNAATMDMIRQMGWPDNSTVRRRVKEAIQFVKNKIDSAKWFISAIKQRHDTLMHDGPPFSRLPAGVLQGRRQIETSADDPQGYRRPHGTRRFDDLARGEQQVRADQLGTILLKSLFSRRCNTESGEEVSSYEIKTYCRVSVSTRRTSAVADG